MLLLAPDALRLLSTRPSSAVGTGGGDTEPGRAAAVSVPNGAHQAVIWAAAAMIPPAKPPHSMSADSSRESSPRCSATGAYDALRRAPDATPPHTGGRSPCPTRQLPPPLQQRNGAFGLQRTLQVVARERRDGPGAGGHAAASSADATGADNANHMIQSTGKWYSSRPRSGCRPCSSRTKRTPWTRPWSPSG